MALLLEQAKAQIESSVEEAVANERRHYEPIMASLNAELETYKAEAIKKATPSFWDENGLWITAVALIGGAIGGGYLASRL